LLAQRIDATSNLGFIRMDDQGKLLVSADLNDQAREMLGLDKCRRFAI
jgi:hypothetical protein